jgi:hypothetical protein
MPKSAVRTCQCVNCRQETSHPDQELYRQMNLLLSRLDEQQRRWYVAVKSNRIGPGGDRLLSQITGLDEKTSRPGWQELAGSLAERPTERIHAPAAGRQRSEKKIWSENRHCRSWSNPKASAIPTVGQKWVRSSLGSLSQRLGDHGHSSSPPTVGRLLRKLGYALRVHVKKQEASAAHPERHQQFEQIEAQKQRFQAVGWPIISVDTKKKESNVGFCSTFYARGSLCRDGRVRAR